MLSSDIVLGRNQDLNFSAISDALFADHEVEKAMTTAANYNTLERQTNSYRSVKSSTGRLSPLPPPLPPLPSDNMLRVDTLTRQSPNYQYNEHSPQIQQIYSSTITISKTVYDTDASGSDDVTRLRSVSPYGGSQYNSLSYSQTSPYSSLRRTQASPNNALQRIEINRCSVDDYGRSGTAVSPSLVSGNMSELDTLLDDLSESTKQYSLSRDRRARELSSTSPVGIDNSTRSGESPVGLSHGRPAYCTPSVADRSRSGSVQRELDIPKLSDMPRTSPTPLSALYPDTSTRQSQSSKDQQTPVHLQPPLVSGPSVSPIHNGSLVKIYQQVDLSQPDLSTIVHPQQSHVQQQYSSLNYGSLPHSAGITRTFGTIPLSTGVTQNYGIVQQSTGITQNYDSLPRSAGMPHGYGTLPFSVGVSQNFGSSSQSTGANQNYGIEHQSAGVTLNNGSLSSSAGFDQNYGSLPHSAGSTRNYSSQSYAVGSNQNYTPDKPAFVSQNYSSQNVANAQPVGAALSHSVHPEQVRQRTPQRWDDNRAGQQDFPNFGGYAEITPVDRNSNGGGPQNARQQGITVQQPNVEEIIQPVNKKSQQAATAAANTDLDDLMASIAEFDMATSKGQGQGGSDPVYAQPMKPKSQSSGEGAGNRPAVDELDSASYRPGNAAGGNQSNPSSHYHAVPDAVQLGKTISSKPVLSGDQLHGQLRGDFDENGLPLVAKGDCAACGQEIVGQVLMALGKLWHVQHFSCVHCKHELGTSIFYERDGLPYCVQDYQELFLPKCAGCGDVILENCLMANNQAWHMEHFRCAECNKPIVDDKYYEKDGRAFCSNDYFRMYAPLCAGCDKPIMTSYITALHRNWHSECFVCAECQLPFDKSAFYELNGSMYCERHFYAHRGATCASCSQPITGRCVTALYKKYHPEHFVCSFCLQPLNKGTFKEQSEKPYCHPCFGKLFG